MRKNIPLLIGSILLGLLLFVMFIGPHLPFIDKNLSQERYRMDAFNKLELPAFEASEKNWIGTDKKGVDNLSKIVIAAKETIFIVIIITLIRYIIAIPLGLLSCKKKGFFHHVINALNQCFSFLPPVFATALLLAIPFLLFTDLRLLWSILILAVVEAGRVAYTIQQQANQLSRESYMEAGIALGLSSRTLVKNYYIPALLPELIVNFCIDLGKVMLLIGQLSIISIFLSHEWREVDYYTNEFVQTGLNWAALLASHRHEIFRSQFGFVFYPAFAMMFTIVTFNLLGEGLRRHYQSTRI
ncbi:peptide/nickel transport system permease protein [Paenibacillus sp. PDC88]|nr:peptide/nickel transport system permease protein [Paenibacillus sp. PDC88]